MNSESVSGYIFILPFVIGFLVFTVFPMLASLVLSFTDYDMLSAPVFVGLKNYKQMFTQDPLIYKTLFNTFYFTITSVPLKLVLLAAFAGVAPQHVGRDSPVRGIAVIFGIPPVSYTHLSMPLAPFTP